MSTRAALAVAHEAKAYAAMGIKEPREEAVNDILLAGAPSEDAEAIKVLIRRFLSES